MDKYLDELINDIRNVKITIQGNETEFSIWPIVSEFKNAKMKNFKVFFLGNGGSAAIAMHMTADYMKNGKMMTGSLYVITCLSNDYGYENVFSKQFEYLECNNILLVAISSSGKSENIINAVEIAKRKNAKVITLTGFEPDNPVRSMGDVNIYVPSQKYGIVESIHNFILQEVVDLMKEEYSGNLHEK